MQPRRSVKHYFSDSRCRLSGLPAPDHDSVRERRPTSTQRHYTGRVGTSDVVEAPLHVWLHTQEGARGAVVGAQQRTLSILAGLAEVGHEVVRLVGGEVSIVGGRRIGDDPGAPAVKVAEVEGEALQLVGAEAHLVA